jgi:hypothetical protein
MKKPKLTLQEYQWLLEVDEDIRECRHTDHESISQMFSDVHNGNLYEHEVKPLCKKGILEMFDCRDIEDYNKRRIPHPRLLGYEHTVYFTQEALDHFWPLPLKKRYSLKKRKVWK